MAIAKIFLFSVTFVTMLMVPEGANAYKKCEDLWGQGKVYNKYTMQRCDLVFKQMTYDAISSYPADLWK